MRCSIFSSGASLYLMMLLFLLIMSTTFAQRLPPANSTIPQPPPSSNVTTTPSNVTEPDVSEASLCSPPFIFDPLSVLDQKSNNDACLVGCCIPCPQQYYYYPEGALDKGFRITTILRALSAICTFILIVSYLVLPNKRNHPALMILFSALAIFIFSSSSFFGLVDPKKIQCANEFIPSTQDNNPLCLIQGTLSVFGSHATAAWLAVLILNLHLHTVWNSQVLQKRYVLLHLFCWGFPFALTTLTVAKGAIRYEFGESCVVGHEHADTFFFFPMFALVIPAFLIHICTFVYIGKISLRARRTNFDSKRSSVGGMLMAFKIQWRALALAVTLISAVIIFSIFYFQIVARLNDMSTNSTKLAKWSRCLLGGLGQTPCAEFAVGILPSPSTMFAAESVISAMGVIFFLLFVVQKQFLKDWRNLIAGHKRRKDIKFLDKLEQRENEERAWEERRHRREASNADVPSQFALYRASEETEQTSYY